MTDIYEDVVNAISFTKWLTEKEIAKLSGHSLSEVKPIIRQMVKKGDLDKKDDKYRYENAVG